MNRTKKKYVHDRGVPNLVKHFPSIAELEMDLTITSRECPFNLINNITSPHLHFVYSLVNDDLT
jgi:hypothetical protein